MRQCFSKNQHNLQHLRSSQNSLPALPNHPLQNPSQRATPSKRQLVARINALIDILEDIKVSIENRIQIITNFRRHGRYFVTCERNHRDECGPTCPLLRPEGDLQLYTSYNNPRGRVWKAMVDEDQRIYLRMVSEMKRLGFEALEHKVEQWEKMAERLRQNTLNQVERYDEMDAWNAWGFREIGSHLKRGWSFENAAGKGPGLEKEVGPTELEMSPDWQEEYTF